MDWDSHVVDVVRSNPYKSQHFFVRCFLSNGGHDLAAVVSFFAPKGCKGRDDPHLSDLLKFGDR